MRGSFRSMFVLLLSLLFIVPSHAEKYKVDVSHSTIGFSIRHLMSKVHGRFTEYTGTIDFDEAAVENLVVDIEIQAASIATDNVNRDKHLRSEDFFQTDSFPTMTFKSTKAYKNDQGMFVDGKLTIKGVTKDVTVPVEVLGVMKGERPVAGFSCTFTINRKDFNVTWNRDLDTGGVVLGDEVKITVDFEARKPKEEPAPQSK